MPSQATSLNLDQHLAQAGPAALSFSRLWERLWQQDYLRPALLELCRLTFARMHGDKVEMAASNPLAAAAPGDAALRQAVLADTALESGVLPAGWRPVLQFAEYYWLDAQSIPDEIAEAVKDDFGEAGLVLLIEALGCIDGRIRAARCLRDISEHRSTREVAHAH
jgi:hypothetical protein